MLLIHRAVFAAACFAAPPLAHAGGEVCQVAVVSATPIRPTVVSSVAIELAPANPQLGGGSGVLAQSFDEALSVDNVLARIRIDGCHAMAKASLPLQGGSIDPAGYKPQTAFDNTPWRFNMTQNGKRMTADEFDAWMKSRGVRVVGRKDASQQDSPAAAVQATK
ncbi:hypothetical protein [Thermomonas paludicola]|uniref:hypothetical protein n=1 Tax=Thermomonas paludicola TaxID=2884874 RepID=UPI0030B86788